MTFSYPFVFLYNALPSPSVMPRVQNTHDSLGLPSTVAVTTTCRHDYERMLDTKTGQVTLRVPRRLPFRDGNH